MSGPAIGFCGFYRWLRGIWGLRREIRVTAGWFLPGQPLRSQAGRSAYGPRGVARFPPRVFGSAKQVSEITLAIFQGNVPWTKQQLQRTGLVALLPDEDRVDRKFRRGEKKAWKVGGHKASGMIGRWRAEKRGEPHRTIGPDPFTRSKDPARVPWCVPGVKVVALGPIENYEALCLAILLSLSLSLPHFHFSFSPALDPIISCPLSGSVCYAIGLRGPDRRAVCFVSLIAERLSGGPLSLLPLRPASSPLLSAPLRLVLLPSTPLATPPSRPRHPFFTLFFVPCNVAPARPPFYF